MNKGNLLIVLGFSIFLTACSTTSYNAENEPKNKTDIYALTKKIDAIEEVVKQKNLNSPLKPQHQKTVDELIKFFNKFNEVQDSNYTQVVEYYKSNNNWIFLSDLKDNSTYEFKLNDGSGTIISFKNLKEHSKKSISIWNITQKQCYYLTTHFNSDDNTRILILENYRYYKKISEYSSCIKKNDYDMANLSFIVEDSNLSYSNKYIQFQKQLNQLIKKQYDEIVNGNHNNRIYFSDKPVSSKIFRNGVDYVINNSNSHIFIGAVTKERCKEIIYHLPDDIQYKVSGGTECSTKLNVMEFFN